MRVITRRSVLALCLGILGTFGALGLSIVDGCCFITWTDNSNSTLDNPGGTATQDLYATRFQFR